jgi:hypothetical protein
MLGIDETVLLPVQLTEHWGQADESSCLEFFLLGSITPSVYGSQATLVETRVRRRRRALVRRIRADGRVLAVPNRRTV